MKLRNIFKSFQVDLVGGYYDAGDNCSQQTVPGLKGFG